MSLPAQALPAYIILVYAYWDGTNALNALPVKMTPHSQVSDWVVFDQNGIASVKTGVRHQSSGDANYWYQSIINPTGPTPTPPPHTD